MVLRGDGGATDLFTGPLQNMLDDVADAGGGIVEFFHLGMRDVFEGTACGVGELMAFALGPFLDNAFGFFYVTLIEAEGGVDDGGVVLLKNAAVVAEVELIGGESVGVSI